MSMTLAHSPEPTRPTDIVVAMTRKGIGNGNDLIAAVADYLAKHPGYNIQLNRCDALGIVEAYSALLALASRIGAELEFWQANVELGRNRMPRLRRCRNCRFFEAVKSSAAHVQVDYQAIVMESGVCCLNPPVAVAVPGKPPTLSYFPPVHPDRGCGHFQDQFDPAADDV